MKPQRIKGFLSGQPCFIIGGGPSAVHVPHENVITTNLGFRLNPNPFGLYFTDCHFYQRYKSEIERQHPTYKLTTCQHFFTHSDYVVFYRGAKVLGDVVRVAGTNSGLQATHAALHMGADPIILVGFDLNDRTHFHNEYLMGGNATTKFLREFEIMRGQNIYLTNEKSALRHIFPYKPLKEFL